MMTVHRRQVEVLHSTIHTQQTCREMGTFILHTANARCGKTPDRHGVSDAADTEEDENL